MKNKLYIKVQTLEDKSNLNYLEHWLNEDKDFGKWELGYETELESYNVEGDIVAFDVYCLSFENEDDSDNFENYIMEAELDFSDVKDDLIDMAVEGLTLEIKLDLEDINIKNHNFIVLHPNKKQILLYYNKEQYLDEIIRYKWELENKLSKQTASLEYDNWAAKIKLDKLLDCFDYDKLFNELFEAFEDSVFTIDLKYMELYEYDEDFNFDEWEIIDNRPYK